MRSQRNRYHDHVFADKWRGTGRQRHYPVDAGSPITGSLWNERHVVNLIGRGFGTALFHADLIR